MKTINDHNLESILDRLESRRKQCRESYVSAYENNRLNDWALFTGMVYAQEELIKLIKDLKKDGYELKKGD